MSNFGLYSFCLIATASLVALLAMSTEFFVAYVNDIVIPCQHDSSWTGVQCNCDNTRGVFSGQYCGECECKHLGICAVVENGNSRWGCRCPNHEKWTGLLCDKCYADLSIYFLPILSLKYRKFFFNLVSFGFIFNAFITCSLPFL